MFLWGDKYLGIIESYLKHDDIFELFSPNKGKDEVFLQNNRAINYLAYFVDNYMCGVVVCENRSNCYVNFHPYMHKVHRANKFKMMAEFEELISSKGVTKMTAEFPCFYDNLKKYAEELGMSLIGVNEKSYNYKGQIFDQYIYGKVI